VDILSKGGVFLEPFMLQLGIFFRKSALVRIPFFAVANSPLNHVFGLPVNFENEPILSHFFVNRDRRQTFRIKRNLSKTAPKRQSFALL